jgi:transaldolase
MNATRTNATQTLHARGQSLWLDNITRDLLTKGTLARYIAELSVTGLTSNPTIFDHAIKGGSSYDAAILDRAAKGLTNERLFFDLALEDITRAAELFRPIHERTDGVDGWVSLEVSPLLAHDARTTLREAKELNARAGCGNLFIKIPGTQEGALAIEQAIFLGIPINVTLLFSRAQYAAAAEAWLRGIERRIEAGLNPNVASVASLFVSRWDVAVAGKVPPRLVNRLGLAVGEQVYQQYSQLLESPRWRRVMNAGARPQRLLFASTGTKDPHAPDTLYVHGLVAPLTINTMPETTLNAFADHGEVDRELAADGGDSGRVLKDFELAGIGLDALATKLQDDGAAAFVASWKELLGVIESKTAALRKAG